MHQLEHNKIILKKYIPEPAVEKIAEWIYSFDFKLKIRKSRSSKLGDYRAPTKGKNHQITVNHDLNPYAFLLTLVHEIAHLSNFNKHQNRVKPHGEEWKSEFKILIGPFLHLSVFPDDVISNLKKYLLNPSASSCSDINLMRVLKQYDDKNGAIYLEEISENTIFKYRKKDFVKGRKIRKRFLCKETKTNREYLFNPLTEVALVQAEIFLHVS